jgi:hypothetical protein
MTGTQAEYETPEVHWVTRPTMRTPLAPSEEKRIALRTRHQVRLVESHEEGSAAASLPRGVYGFTASAGLAAPLFAAQRYRNFEVHHLRDGDIAIVGFVSPAEFIRLQHAHVPIDITLYPDIDGESSEIVAVSYTRIEQHRQYSIRNTPGLVLHIAPQVETAGA